MPRVRRPRRRCTLVAPPDQSVGQSLSFSSATTAATDYGTRFTTTSTSVGIARSATPRRRIPPPSRRRISRIRTSRPLIRPRSRRSTSPAACRRTRRPSRRPAASTRASISVSRSTAQLLEHLLDRRGADAGANPGVRHGCDADQPGSVTGRQQRPHADPGHGRERREPLRCRYHRQVHVLRGHGRHRVRHQRYRPAADLTLTGHYQYAGSWGVISSPAAARRRRPCRRAPSSTRSSRRPASSRSRRGLPLRSWPPICPTSSAIRAATPCATSRSGRPTRTTTSMLRSSNSGLNGMPQLQTPDATMALQAALQHVVLTYDPINGRQIYVNGVNQNMPDPQKGGTISNWDTTFALVLGSEVSGDDSFQGHQVPRDPPACAHRRPGDAELQCRRGPALLHAVQHLQRAGRQCAAGVHDVHGEPVR